MRLDDDGWVVMIFIINMQGQVWRIVESVVAFILLILTIIYWNRNQLGQNLINFEAVGMWAVGL